MAAPVQQQLLDAVRERLGARPDPDWSVRVQGAVGHVVGLRTDDQELVLKVVDATAPERFAEREQHALRLVADHPLPVPRLLAAGTVPGPPPRAYLVLTRLPGQRLADRRSQLDAAASGALHREMGGLLRRFHAASPPAPDGWGGLLPGDRRWPTLGAAVTERCDRLVAEYRRAGGPAAVADAVAARVAARLDVLDACPAPVLVHGDLNDANLLVGDGPAPRVTGVVDLERASFTDPLHDLAHTLRNAEDHGPAAAILLREAYGVDAESGQRLAVHHLLGTLAERLWVGVDHPPGWAASQRRLDSALVGALDDLG